MRGCAIPDSANHKPLLNPFPSDSVAPMISNCAELYLSRKVIGTPKIPLQYLLYEDSAVHSLSMNISSAFVESK